LDLEVEKIHMCKNDCILYREDEYEDIEKFPICGLVDSIVEKMTVMTRTTTEEMAGLKKCFATFLSFLVWSVILLMTHSGETLIHKILNLSYIWGILGSQWAHMAWTHSWTLAHIAHDQLWWRFWTFLLGCVINRNILCCQTWYQGHNNLGMTSTLISGLWLMIWWCCGTIMEWRCGMSTRVSTFSFKSFCLWL
jgi:hypothetical protein